MLVLVSGAALTQPAALAKVLERDPRCAGHRFVSAAPPHPPRPPDLQTEPLVDSITVARLAADLCACLPRGPEALATPSASASTPTPIVLLLALPAAAHALGADPVPLWQDQALRAALTHLGWPYRLVVGQGALAQTAAALMALGVATSVPAPFPASGMAAERQRLRALGCEKCSDPECEHRLFTSLAGLQG